MKAMGKVCDGSWLQVRGFKQGTLNSLVAIIIQNRIDGRMVSPVHDPANDKACVPFRVKAGWIYIPKKMGRKPGDEVVSIHG
jgi:hypothetical protein